MLKTIFFSVRPTFGLVLLLCGFFAANPASAVPILVNSGFETGALNPWIAQTGAPTVTSAEAHTGSFSVSAFGGDEIRQNFAPVATSLVSEVSFWVMRKGGAFDQYSLYYDDGSSGTFLVSGATSEWTFFDVTSNLAAGKNLTGLSIFGTSPGPAFLDDFLVDARIAVPEPGTLGLLSFGILGLAMARRRRQLH